MDRCWILFHSLTRFVFDDFAGERPSCEDPQPLDGYEGWGSSGLAAHHSDDLAASGCLEPNPKLGKHINQVIEAYRNILVVHIKRYQHIKTSQNTSAHLKHINTCQNMSKFVRNIKSDRNISKDIHIYQTTSNISKHIKPYQNISNHIN